MLEEFYISRTVTKEVYIEPDPLDFEKDSTVASFVMGFFICFLIWSITILIYCLVKRYREKSSVAKSEHGPIVLRELPPQDNSPNGPHDRASLSRQPIVK